MHLLQTGIINKRKHFIIYCHCLLSIHIIITSENGVYITFYKTRIYTRKLCRAPYIRTTDYPNTYSVSGPVRIYGAPL